MAEHVNKENETKPERPRNPYPDDKDLILSMPHTGGIFMNQVCFSFSVHIHEIVRQLICMMERIATDSGGYCDMRELANRLRKWTRKKLEKETKAWITSCPILPALYQFSFTEMVRQYALAFPVIRSMGIRITPLSDFIYCLLLKVYEDPSVESGSFSSLDNGRTFAIISQRLQAALCEAMKVTYFPRYSPATSALWRIEPQIPVIESAHGADISQIPEDDNISLESLRLNDIPEP